ncbi:transposable element Tcb2 transposase [Trichonephila clavipes]|nr:transposable element Tcb2 transposase [Trichonephila clavipes]
MHTALTPGVKFGDAISYDSRSSLVIIHTSLTAQKYVDTILGPVVLSVMTSQLEVSFQQDNASLIPLAYLWTAFTSLILFLGQQGNQTFHHSNIFGTF